MISLICLPVVDTINKHYRRRHCWRRRCYVSRFVSLTLQRIHGSRGPRRSLKISYTCISDDVSFTHNIDELTMSFQPPFYTTSCEVAILADVDNVTLSSFDAPTWLRAIPPSTSKSSPHLHP
eukprot:11084765-Heterocapsa_arctica.AAC.1